LDSSTPPAIAQGYLWHCDCSEAVSGETTMPKETDRTTSELHNDSETQKKVNQRLNRLANKAAAQGEDEEQRYDQDHGIFTK
jgi:hypothetical protein